jgi:hypothetical protein
MTINNNYRNHLPMKFKNVESDAREVNQKDKHHRQQKRYQQRINDSPVPP